MADKQGRGIAAIRTIAGRLSRVLAITALALTWSATAHATSLRFFGNGLSAPDLDRVKIELDEVATTTPGPPADVGATDFTIEFWMKTPAAENTAPSVACGDNINWIYGNIVFDRDRYNQDRKFGISIAGGEVVWGVSGDGSGPGANEHTICATGSVLDGQWRHVAVQRRRSDGQMSLYVDGNLEAQEDGPDGDVSYPDDGVPCGNCCGGNCNNSDPFLVIGAEKHDAGAAFPSYSGWIDEVRLSSTLRYAGSFVRPSAPFTPDGATVALYHLDEGGGDAIGDSSGASGGPSDGVRRFGGSPAGPDWSAEEPFGAPGDLDGDGTPDAADECTIVLFAGQVADKARLAVKRLDAAPGGQKLLWRGSFVPAAGDPAPEEKGVHVRVADAGGTLLDVSVPGGLVGAHPSTPCDVRDGWSVRGSASRPLFVYRNFSGFVDAACSTPAQGLQRIVVKDRRATPRGDVAFVVKGRDGAYTPVTPPSNVQAVLVLAARPAPGTASPEAIAGACGEYRWTDPISPGPALPSCREAPPSGPTQVVCKGP